MSAAVIAVLVGGQTLNALCESFCPAHSRVHAAQHVTTTAPAHEHGASHHAAPAATDDDTAVRFDASPSACCDTAATTLTATRAATTRHDIALASVQGMPWSPALLHQSPRVRLASPLGGPSHAPVPLTLRI